jgi:hypothetical protein
MSSTVPRASPSISNPFPVQTRGRFAVAVDGSEHLQATGDSPSNPGWQDATANGLQKSTHA